MFKSKGTDIDTQLTSTQHSKMPRSCLFVAAALIILFRINWRCVNRVFRERRIFNSHNNHVWLEANRHAAGQFARQV
jgi:hypothetical protein